jgi:flavin reductase (DIM6/NTAB) family NADH-FMN oxidoreductase RutF
MGTAQQGLELLDGGQSSAPDIEQVANVREEVSALQFRDALSKVASAVTIVATDGPGGAAGLTCSAVCPVSDTPPTLLVCVNRSSAVNQILKANRVLCVNGLRADHVELSQLFAGVGCVPMSQRFAPDRWRRLSTGAPCCKDSLVALDCRVTDVREIGTHSVFFAKVVATLHARNADPLIYFRRSYATALARHAA